MMKRCITTSLLILCIAYMGCSDAADEGMGQQNTTTASGQNGKADFASATERLGPVPAFEGAYELRVDSEVTINHSETGETSTLVSGIAGIASLVRTDNEVSIKFSPCRVTLPKIDGNEFSIPDETVESLGTMDIEAVLTAAETAYQLTTTKAAFVAGAQLDAPINEALPDEEDDSRVLDTEGDEYPGVTVLVRGKYKIFSVVRVIFELNALMGTDDVWSGGAELNMDLAVLGDKVPLTNAKRVINEQLEIIEIAEQNNQVTLRPIDDAQGTCAELYGE